MQDVSHHIARACGAPAYRTVAKRTDGRTAARPDGDCASRSARCDAAAAVDDRAVRSTRSRSAASKSRAGAGDGAGAGAESLSARAARSASFVDVATMLRTLSAIEG